MAAARAPGGASVSWLSSRCGHSERLADRAMLATAGAKPAQRVLDPATAVRCRECDAKGRAAVSIKWAGQAE
jgi:hypothetical protein